MGHEDLPTEHLDDEDRTAVHQVLPLDLDEGTARTAALICISGRSVGQMFVIDRDTLTIGRAPECDIFLDDEGVSRVHARIARRGDQHVLSDAGSTNGTYHEGERIRSVELVDGDKLQVGTATILQFRVQDQREVQFHSLMQTFKTHDPLTEALNKRGFLMELEKEVGFARRHALPLSLVMFDLDHFKRINDTYGHPGGDAVLRAVSQRVLEGLRKEDVLGRYGGEEFALLLRNTPLDRAFIVAERLRRSIEELEIVHNGRRIPCTTSVGVAALDETLTRPQDLVEAADSRLYEAKRKGRNRTEVGLFD